MNNTQEYFDSKKYIVMNNALPEEVCIQLTNYMFKLHDEGKLQKDTQCPLSDSIYGDPIFQKILEEFAEPIGNHVGKKLSPTYSYARIYRNGEILKKHTDREACEVSATLTLGFNANNIWPIFVDEKNEIPIELNVGEMMIYKGCEIVHWRPAFKGEWHVQLFLHYVEAEGKFKDHKDDSIKKLKPISENNIFPNYYCINRNNHPELMFSLDECKKILSRAKDSYSMSAGIGGTKEISTISKEIRSAQIYLIENTSENRWLFDKINHIVRTANLEYFDFDLIDLNTPINLIEYSNKEGETGHYSWHMDNGIGDSATRKISFVAQLSNSIEYSGCNLVLNNSGVEYTASKERGTVHLFPSYTLHTVTPINAGVRYSLVTWIHGLRRFR